MSPAAEKLTDAPLQFDRSAELGAPPAGVFAFVADFPSLPQWMPMMKRVEVDNSKAKTPGGVGAVRVIHSGQGKPTRETVTIFELSKRLAYSASDKSLMGMFTDHLGVITFEPSSKGTRLVWKTYARSGKNPAMAAIGQLVFRFVFWKSLGNLKKKFPVK